MKQPILTPLFLLFIITCQAQNFQLTRSDQTRYYRMGDSNSAVSLHVIESSTADGDSIFVFEKQMIRAEHANDWDCYAPDASWLGSGLRISPEGNNHIITAAGEEILLITQAGIGESWTAWTAADASMHLEATVTSIEQEEVMGEMEMVLSISMQMQYEEGSTGSAAFEEFEVKIGANFGLIESPPFALFPDNAAPTTIMDVSKATLEGIEGEAGWQDFSWMDVMDFEPGDEVHIDQGSSLGSVGSWEKSALTFLSREEYPDSIVYEVERAWWSFSDLVPPGAEPIVDEGISIESMVIYPDTLFDTRPYAPVLFEEPMAIGYILRGKSGDRHFKIHGMFSTISPYLEFDEANDCYAPFIHSGCGGLSYPGLGGPYYDCDFQSGPGGQWRKLLYYKKDNVEWGNPLSTSDQRFEKRTSLLTYPNPSQGSFRIALDASEYPAAIEVFDLRGQLLHRQQLNSEGGEVQLSSIPPQLLSLQVSSFTGNLYSGRMLLIE